MCPLEHQLLGHGEGLGSCGSSVYNLISPPSWRSPYAGPEQKIHNSNAYPVNPLPDS